MFTFFCDDVKNWGHFPIFHTNTFEEPAAVVENREVSLIFSNFFEEDIVDVLAHGYSMGSAGSTHPAVELL